MGHVGALLLCTYAEGVSDVPPLRRLLDRVEQGRSLLEDGSVSTMDATLGAKVDNEQDIKINKLDQQAEDMMNGMTNLKTETNVMTKVMGEIKLAGDSHK